MPADFVITQGDVEPVFAQQIIETNYVGTTGPVNISGASVRLNLRALTSPTPLTLTGTISSPIPTSGLVQWQPSAADTAVAGDYQGKWFISWPGGQVQSYPTDGYVWVRIEPNVASESQALVSLPDVKDYLNSYGLGPDRSHDAKLLGFVQAATPIIENIVGPVIVRNFEEWHDGGSDLIELHHQPSTALGTSPVLHLVAASEYRGPIEYPLQIVASPTFGSIYSVFLDKEMGSITRRTAGGRTIAFMPGRNSVHVIYQAGQAAIPANVREATLESIRQHYQTTMATGTGSMTEADTFDAGIGVGFGELVDRIARQSLTPMRQFPSFA